MRRSFASYLDNSEEEINVTPLLDVVFIMLIFFIVTSSFVTESGIEVNRPIAKTAEKQEQVNIFVAVSPFDEIWINKFKVEPSQIKVLLEGLHAENPKGSIVIQADELANVKPVVQVMDAARKLGINYTLATKLK